MSHFIKKCRGCGTVLGQCRCPSPDKTVVLAECSRYPKCTTPAIADGTGQSEHAWLSEKLDAALDENKLLHARCERMESEHKALIAEVDTAKRDRDWSNTACEALRACNRQLVSELGETQALLRTVEAERDGMKHEVSSAENETEHYKTLASAAIRREHAREIELRELREAAEDLCDEAEATVSAHGREYGLNDLSNAAEHARAVLAKVTP